MKAQQPDKIPEPSPGGALGSTCAGNTIGPAWLMIEPYASLRFLKIAPFSMLFVLAGCGYTDNTGSQMSRQITQWVPSGTLLPAAKQTMENHGFTCTVSSYSSNSEMPPGSDPALWDVFGKDNLSGAVTNVSILHCKRIDTSVNYEATLDTVNGKIYGGLFLTTTTH